MTNIVKYPDSARAWITASAVAALGAFGNEADAAVVVYQLTGPVELATSDAVLVGQPMYVQWSVDSAALVDSTYGRKTTPVLDFRFGVEGSSEQWAGTGGGFYFSANNLLLYIPPTATYTRQGSIIANQAYFDYRNSVSDGAIVTDWTADGLPAGISFAFLDAVTSAAFFVTNASGTSRISMNITEGVAFALVPEPKTASLLGLAGLAALRRRKRGHD